jgi:hypothetical protein
MLNAGVHPVVPEIASVGRLILDIWRAWHRSQSAKARLNTVASCCLRRVTHRHRPGGAVERASDGPPLGRLHAAVDRATNHAHVWPPGAISGSALFSELKQLAIPATLDTPTLDLGVEDHGTAAPLSARKTDVALGMLEDLLAIELMLAHDLLAVAPTQHVLGDGTDAALRMVWEAIATADPRADAIHRVLRERFPVRQADEFAASGRSAAQ